jgi:hypothetical protein
MQSTTKASTSEASSSVPIYTKFVPGGVKAFSWQRDLSYVIVPPEEVIGGMHAKESSTNEEKSNFKTPSIVNDIHEGLLSDNDMISSKRYD